MRKRRNRVTLTCPAIEQQIQDVKPGRLALKPIFVNITLSYKIRLDICYDLAKNII